MAQKVTPPRRSEPGEFVILKPDLLDKVQQADVKGNHAEAIDEWNAWADERNIPRTTNHYRSSE